MLGKAIYGMMAILAATAVEAQERAIVPVAQSYDWNWNGVAVSNDHRLFANFPRWEEGNNPALVEVLEDGSLKPYPGGEWNEWQPGKAAGSALVYLNSVYIEREENHLWAIDGGNPFNGDIIEGAPKLVEIDLSTNEVAHVYPFDETVLPKGSYLNDIRIDGDRVYITESGIGAILILDRKTKKIRRLLANSNITKADKHRSATVEGYPLQGEDGNTPMVHADQIELSPAKDSLYFMSPFGPNIYRVATADLNNEALSEQELEKRISLDRQTAPLGGFIMDDKGNFYLSEIESRAIHCQGPDKQTKWMLQDDRLLWPDALSIAPDGWIYVATAQINRMPFMRKGRDDRQAPFVIYRFRAE